MAEIIQSKFHNIRLKLTGWDEPNNGRMLHTADLEINGRNENERYFQNWNRLDERLEKCEMDSPDKKFVFIPAEGGGFVIDMQNLNKIALPYKGISTVTFLGNSFWGNILGLIHVDEIILFNLSNHLSSRINFKEGNVIWATMNEKNELLVTYLEKGTKAQLTKTFDFKLI